MDFLTSVQNPTPPMKPIGPSPDGTPPLPLLNHIPNIPPRPIFPDIHPSESSQHKGSTQVDPSPESIADVFESDPFFNSPGSHEVSDSATPFPVSDELTSDHLPGEIEIPARPPEPAPPLRPTAEERLLETIVSDSTDRKEKPVPHLEEGQLAHLRKELARTRVEIENANATRDKTLKEFHALKIRCAALESELASAREGMTQVQQAGSQTESRFAEAEKQWTEKLSHLRQMLDDVEDTRDQVFQKRVPKLLFIGTLIAGIIATIFAYLIGASQPTPSPMIAENTPKLTTPAPALEPVPKPIPLPEPTVAVPPPPAPLLLPETQTTPPPPVSPTPIAPAPPAVTQHPKPTPRVAVKTAIWPTLTGSRWITTSSSKEMKLVFNYGTFTRGTELSTIARQDLKAIAASLKGKPYQIEVEGHTDSAKVSKTKAYGHDNEAIGLARAKAVANYLISSGGLPSSMISTSSAGETNPPYPNTTAANQLKNRTVVLKITTR